MAKDVKISLRSPDGSTTDLNLTSGEGPVHLDQISLSYGYSVTSNNVPTKSYSVVVYEGMSPTYSLQGHVDTYDDTEDLIEYLYSWNDSTSRHCQLVFEYSGDYTDTVTREGFLRSASIDWGKLQGNLGTEFKIEIVKMKADVVT